MRISRRGAAVPRRVAGLAVAVVLVVTGLTACGGSDTPEPDPDDTPSDQFDPSALDLGRIDPTGTDVSSILDADHAKQSAAYRLGSYLVLPTQVDRTFVGYGVESGPLVTASDFDFALSEAADALGGAQTGLLTRRTRDDADAWITTALLQFPDAATATAAAEAAARAIAAPTESGWNDKVIEPVADDELAWGVVPLDPESAAANQIYVLRAYGPFVAYVWVYDISGDMDDVRELAGDFLVEQEDVLYDVDPVTITDTPKLRELDPSGLWHLTLAMDSRGTVSDRAFTAGRHAAQVNLINTDGAERLFTKAGISRVASNLTTLYSARSQAGAQDLVDGLADLNEDVGLADADPPQGLPEARCFAKDDDADPALSWYPDFSCFLAFGSYAVESSGVSLVEAHQRISAQVVLIHEDTKDEKRSSTGG